MDKALLAPGLLHVPKAEIWNYYGGREAYAESCLKIHNGRARSRLIFGDCQSQLKKKNCIVTQYAPEISSKRRRDNILA